MGTKLLCLGCTLLSLMTLLGRGWPQTAQQTGTLVVSGQPGQAPVLQIGGKSYVNIEALARLTNGALSFEGNQITLTLLGFAGNTYRLLRQALRQVRASRRIL